jgi:hypothetical protein
MVTMRRRASAALATIVVVVAIIGGCASHGSSSRPAGTEATTSTDALDGARTQLDDINRQLGQAAEDSKAAQAGLDNDEGDTNP